MKPRRIQRKRVKGWRMPENTVYVGRPTKYGNQNSVCNGDYRLASALFIAGLRASNVDHRPFIKDVRKNLQGKNLACWCPLDKPCHADFLLKIANEKE